MGNALYAQAFLSNELENLLFAGYRSFGFLNNNNSRKKLVTT